MYINIGKIKLESIIKEIYVDSKVIERIYFNNNWEKISTKKNKRDIYKKLKK